VYVSQLDPVAFHVGPLAIRWYGLAYIGGFLAGLGILAWLRRREKLLPPGAWMDDLVLYMVVGVVLGGRLGEVLLYRPAYYLQNPLEIFAIWKGGMASHGGMAGVVVAAALFAYRRGFPALILLDALALAAPVGLFLGRLANFVNGELVGAPTALPWAVVFPAFDDVPRHPVQIYQAIVEGPLLFLVLFLLPYPKYGFGTRAALFAVAYGVGRFATEPFRNVDPGYLGYTSGLTNGQIYSLVLAAAGAVLLVTRRAAARGERRMP